MSVAFQSFHHIKNPTNTTCMGCLQSFQRDSKVSLLGCDHILHARCARDYVKSTKTPLCGRCFTLIPQKNVGYILSGVPKHPKGFGKMTPDILTAIKGHTRESVHEALINLYAKNKSVI